ncbi:MAG: Putative glycogen debranching enzyme, archaeal type, TIGR01561 [Ktedonobacterales bacterium]|jgi:predicted glycogen debranching enzyme|nr:MAG: Putative glycogen debranching enzyme, archaeal type, TIGR01561 [Ktedonobacterales bacterium]
MTSPTPSPLPELRLDPATLSDLDADLAREWLVTNGLGGYALGSVCGATTRAYSGLLVAAVRPPTERAVLVAKVDETATLAGGSVIALGTNEYADGTIYPRGYERLAGFALDGSIPRWTYRLGDGMTLEKRVWMEHGYNITFVQYRYMAAEVSQSVALAVTPFCLDRDHHGVTTGAADWHFLVEAAPSACTVRAFADAHPYRLIAGPNAHFTPTGEWNWHLFHRAERARGLPATEDAYMPGTFALTLSPGDTATLVLSAEAAPPVHLAGIGGDTHEAVTADALARERAREAALLARAGETIQSDDFMARLTLAADQFLVARPPDAADTQGTAADGASVTVIAGYPWFTDWGRDTMIALPGLTLTTRRYAEARGLLLTFARYLSQGMIPNRFPDSGMEPEYNTVDATLWYVHALSAYLDATQDWPLLDTLFPKIAEIIDWHVRGTRYGIDVDPADGLLRAGAPGVQLTWMDAKVGDWVVTPRWGKPVEINALWYRALGLAAAWAARLGGDPARYQALKSAVEQSFLARFWYAAGGYLYDVVDVNGQAGAVDAALRPNQLFALALARPLIPDEQARTLLSLIERELVTPLGLRTLSPEDPRFVGVYGGDQRARDGAYHQGTVWPWLLGAYVDAHARVYGAVDARLLRGLLEPFRAHLHVAGIGTISEIASGAPPYLPAGCIAQAWSVAELLRIAATAAGSAGW